LSATPPFPLTLDGASLLHQMFRFDWAGWRRADASARQRVIAEAGALLGPLETHSSEGRPNQSALFAQLGHKGDLLLIHFRDSIEQLATLQRDLARTELGSFLGATHSYLSIVELGLYESSVKTYSALGSQKVEPFGEEWERQIEEMVDRQSSAMAARLFPSIPETKYVCFYPMDKRRGEHVNWYSAPMGDRARMMHEHGLIGRRFAGTVKQIISGSIGLDDWEWGVDLFSNNPGVFKKLIYEMRFDEASALYGLFGAFYVGVRLPVAELGSWLSLPGAHRSERP
jgi:hydrogen peroxide-dependent heme synthase